MNKRSILFLLSAFIPWASFAAESQLNPATSWGDSLLRTQRGRGHPGDKAAIMSGDVITGLAGRGYNGSAFTTSDGVSIELQASQDWTGAANGTQILFKTTPNGSATPVTVLTIGNDGGVTPTTYQQEYLRTSAQITITTPTAAGLRVFDTTLKIPVWSSGTATCRDYVTAAGALPSGY